MTCRLTFAFPLLIFLLLMACASRSPSEGAPSPAATQPRLQTLAPADNPATTSGQFEVKNTSPDMPEVLVESMNMIFEYQLEPAGPWRLLAAACEFDPAAPVLVRETQSVRYNCQLQHTIPPEAELRATVEIRLLGSDQIFRLQVQQ